MDADFDPEAHDKAMRGAFNDSYYQAGEEGDFAGEGGYDDEDVNYDADGKPTWDDDIDIEDIMDEDEPAAASNSKKSKKKDKKSKNQDDDDGPIEMDADFVDGNEGNAGQQNKEMSKKEKKKLKKKLKAAEEKAQAKKAKQQDGDEAVDEDEMNADTLPNIQKEPEVEPKTAEEKKKRMDGLVEEYYGLDYEDVVSTK